MKGLTVPRLVNLATGLFQLPVLIENTFNVQASKCKQHMAEAAVVLQ